MCRNAKVIGIVAAESERRLCAVDSGGQASSVESARHYVVLYANFTPKTTGDRTKVGRDAGRLETKAVK